MRLLNLILFIAILTSPLIGQPIAIQDLNNYIKQCKQETTYAKYSAKYMLSENYVIYRKDKYVDDTFWYHTRPTVEGFYDYLKTGKTKAGSMTSILPQSITTKGDTLYLPIDLEDYLSGNKLCAILLDGTIIYYNPTDNKTAGGKYKSEMPSIKQLWDWMEEQSYDSVFVIQSYQLNTGHYVQSGSWMRKKKYKTIREILEELQIQGLKD